jgi:uncharacterized membrane protein YkvA (DUF1232 family)
MAQTGLSYEQLGSRLGISGMSIRRWKDRPTEELPKLYKFAVREVTLELIAEGSLAPHDPLVVSILKDEENRFCAAALTSLGMSSDFLKDGVVDSERMVNELQAIGAKPSVQKTVQDSGAALQNFRTLGEQWSKWIGTLLEVFRSQEAQWPDRCIASGALFYLLMPIDLIPDYIPVIGLLDDFAVLGMAASYFYKRLKDLEPGA